MPLPTRVFAVDLAERTAATYAESLIGLLAAAQLTGKVNLSVLGAAAVAALPAGLAALKTAVKQLVGTPVTTAPAPLPQAPGPVVAPPAPTSLDDCLAVLGQLAAFEAAREALKAAPATATPIQPVAPPAL